MKPELFLSTDDIYRHNKRRSGKKWKITSDLTIRAETDLGERYALVDDAPTITEARERRDQLLAQVGLADPEAAAIGRHAEWRDLTRICSGLRLFPTFQGKFGVYVKEGVHDV